MMTYFLVFLVVLFFVGAAQYSEAVMPPTTVIRPFWGKHLVHNKEVLYLYFVSSLTLICVSGLRFRVGTDFGAYFLGTDRYANQLSERILTLHEPGYSIIAAFARTLGFTDGRGAIFLASAITIGCICFVFYKYSDQLLLATLLYFLFFWTAGFNGVRQCLAVSMIFLGYGALRDRKFWLYALWVAVAYLFHRSAICMIVPYFLVYEKVSWRNLLLVSIVCIFATEFYENLFNFANWVMKKEYTLEEGSYMYKGVNILRVLSGIAPALYFALPKLAKGAQITKEETFCINLLIMRGAICLVCMHSPGFYRMAMYFSPFAILAMCYLIKTSAPAIRRPLAFVVCFLYLIFFLYETTNSSSLCHFHFIWDKAVWYPGMG